jgi:ribosomal protein L7/L12
VNDAIPILTLIASGLTVSLCLTILGKVNAIANRLDRNDLTTNGIAVTPGAISDTVRELSRDPGRKIEAIKVLREETGLGLAEAKRVVEDLARNG